MKKLVLVLAIVAIAAGASAATATQPANQSIDPQVTIQLDTVTTTPATTEFECRYGQPSCTKDTDCDDYCGVGWGDCDVWCCWCLG